MSEVEADRGLHSQLGLPGVLPPGTMLGGFEVKSVLGKGAFGITYRAVDTKLHRDVAIKEYLPTTLALREGRTTVLPHSPAHAEQFAWGRERFLEEARTLARLERTPGIVRVYDFLEANGTAYMVMALIDGETLLARLTREQRLTPEAVERLLGPLLDGLEEFHAATFLHRDIKPANIMVDDKGKPTLIDFGASRAAMAERSTTMTAVFTPGYAAAEQFVPSSKLGPSTDIYGLSATLYHAITGHIPPSAFERILKDNYEPLSELRPEGFPESLLAGIDAGMAVPAADRPQSIAEWRHVLRTGEHQAAAHEVTQVERRPRLLARAARRSRKAGITLRGPALWGAAAGIFLLLAGGSYFAFQAGGAGSTAYNLTAEQLEQALAERRKADALAAEKKHLLEEAQRKAEAEAEAKRQADSELEQARQARQKAEQELAQVKADIEARRQAQAGQQNQQASAEQRAAEEAAQRKAEADAAALRQAEADAAALRQAEQEAQKKAAAEAETKRLADEALAKAEAEKRKADEEAAKVAEAEAAKLKADEEARQKAEAAAKAKGDAEALQKVAEANERALRLEPVDRQRLQVALTSLGFDTRGSDGVFGPRSREMIAAWQKSRNEPTTGHLSGPQQEGLLKQASMAVGKFDDEQKRLEDEKKAADEARARSAAAMPASMSAGGTSPSSADGLWRGTWDCGRDGNGVPYSMKPEFRVINGSGTWYPGTSSGLSNDSTASLRISIDGPNVTVARFRVNGGSTPAHEVSGRVDADSIRGSSKVCTLSLTRDPSPAQTASSQFDGTYTGVTPVAGGSPSRPVRIVVTGGRGSGVISSATRDTPFEIAIAANGRITGTLSWGAPSAPLELQGEASANGLSLSLGGPSAVSYGNRTWLARGDIAKAAATGPQADEARARTVAAAPGLPAGRTSPTSADGMWRGSFECGRDGNAPPVALKPEFKVINGSGTWYVPNPGNASNDWITAILISIEGSNVTAFRRHQSNINPINPPLPGTVEKDSIRASNKFCTLSLTRDLSTGQTAPSAYDGTYAFTTSPRQGMGPAASTATFTLKVTRGSGLVLISQAGCTTSQFDATISTTGEISGQGELKCVIYQESMRSLVGLLTIGGRISDKTATLRLYPRTGSEYSVVLQRSAN